MRIYFSFYVVPLTLSFIFISITSHKNFSIYIKKTESNWANKIESLHCNENEDDIKKDKELIKSTFTNFGNNKYIDICKTLKYTKKYNKNIFRYD